MCCKGCTKRKAFCHDSCPEYKEWKKNETEKKKWLAEKNKHYGVRLMDVMMYGDSRTKRKAGLYRDDYQYRY